MNVLSLFDGMSCGQIALDRAGVKYKTYYASEINNSAINVCMDNYPNTIQLGNVSLINIDVLPKIDLLIGGSPCQDLRPNREGLRGEKSKLFYEYLRVLNDLRKISPNIKFLLENVYKISPDDKQIISELLGVKPEFICSSRFSAQKRKRLYWTNIPISELPINDLVLSDIIIPSDNRNLYLTQKELDRAVIKHAAQTYKTGNKMGSVKFPTPLNEKSKCINVVTIKADRATTHIIDKHGIRILSIEEREILQTLPVGYTKLANEKERFNMTGNGWTVDVIAHILKGLTYEI